jgi:tRNA(Ile)-lysidine synthase
MLRAAGAAALDAEALFAPLAPCPALLLAVSGGPDSTALMLLAARWSGRAQKTIEIATVDHGLRAESRAEAESVARAAAALGFRCHLLRWDGEKPKARLQERARDARYALLAHRARALAPGAAIVTAHHAEDQAETILFRLTRGSGVAGLAGMSEVGEMNGVALLRPLLSVTKAALIALCVAEGAEYARDPGNENPAFARVRLRGLAGALAAQGLDAYALRRLGARAATADEALRHCAAELGERALRSRDAAGARFDAAVFRATPVELMRRALGAEIERLGAAPHLRLDALERAALRLRDALARETPLRLTIGGASVAFRAGFVEVTRAPPRRRGA